MTINLDGYGFELDTSICYVAFNWTFIVLAITAVVGIRLVKKFVKEYR